MASLQPQVWIRPNESFFLLAGNTVYNAPATFQDEVDGTAEIISVGPTSSQLSFVNALGEVVNGITQSGTNTTLTIANKTIMNIGLTSTTLNGFLSMTDYPTSNAYMIIKPPSIAVPGAIENHAEAIGGTLSSIKFASDGSITTTDTLQVGSTPSASVTVGPASECAVMGPDRFQFQTSGVSAGGLYLQGSTVNLCQGTDHLTTGVGITVGPSTIGFRKPVDAKGGVSMTANGNIITVSTDNNVGGLYQAINGNYTLNMQVNGTNFAPSGTGGQIYSMNSGIGTMCNTTFNTGLNSTIAGAGDGVMNLTATGTINLNAPNVLINGTALTTTAPTWYYQNNASQGVNQSGFPLGSGTWMNWQVTTYITAGYPNPMDACGNFWTVPFSGVYFITITLYGTPLNIYIGQTNEIVLLLTNPGTTQIGTTLGMTGGVFTLTMSCYANLTAGTKLSVQGGLHGQIIVQPGCSWTIEYINA